MTAVLWSEMRFIRREKDMAMIHSSNITVNVHKCVG